MTVRPAPRGRVRSRAVALMLGTAVVTATALVALPQLNPAAAATGRTETPLVTHSPATDVAVSEVTIDAPLPASFGAHPAACDKLSYLRYRSTRGPVSSSAADKILLTQPGALAGASSLDGIARHTIQNAAAGGKYIEVWAIDRRANCLEDNSGFTAAVAADDPAVALNYYYRGAVVNGRKFAGYVPDKQLGWLSRMGMQQTVLDEYTLLTTEVPDAATRKAKVWCGGHSLGGVVTGFFKASDFDGDPKTTADAGYNQCAGYFALDTQIATTVMGGEVPEPATMSALVKAGKGAVNAAYDNGLLPRSLNLPVVNPETTSLLALAGVYAQLRPGGISPLATFFKDNQNVTTALRVLLSKDTGAAVTGIPSAYDFRFTNEAALGGLLDDNSMPLAVLQESVGFFTGGKIADKDFPTPNDLLTFDALKGTTQVALGTDKKAIPDDPGPLWKRGSGPVYGWLNYDQVTAADIAKAKDGKPFTTPAKEVTDIGDLARNLGEYPLDFTEHYFPLSMMTDTALWASGDRSTVPTAIHLDQLKNTATTVNLIGGDGLVVPSFKGTTPPNTVILPGYQHLDVLTAAAKQNDGSPEKGAATLAAFILSH